MPYGACDALGAYGSPGCYRAGSNVTGMLAAGLIGGALSGRRTSGATIAAAIIGAGVAGMIERRNRRSYYRYRQPIYGAYPYYSPY